MMATFLSSVQPDIYPGAGFVVDLNINELCASDAIRPMTKRINYGVPIGPLQKCISALETTHA